MRSGCCRATISMLKKLKYYHTILIITMLFEVFIRQIFCHTILIIAMLFDVFIGQKLLDKSLSYYFNYCNAIWCFVLDKSFVHLGALWYHTSEVYFYMNIERLLMCINCFYFHFYTCRSRLLKKINIAKIKMNSHKLYS